jgi:SAM-dependent methyltransferase
MVGDLYSHQAKGGKDGTALGGSILRQSYFDANRANWNERADIHFRDETGFYRIDEILAGRPVLTPIEQAELPPLEGKKIAHFQCHIGTDTLSLELLGAASVTGLDFSARALEHARTLAARARLGANFIEGSVYDAPQLLGGDFDLVFTSWGTITWLDDLSAWGRAIAGVLKPGGRLYFADSHPMALVFEDGGAGEIALHFDYETPIERPLVLDEEHTYNLSSDRLSNTRTYEWQHSIAQVLNSLIEAGIAIDWVHEHDEIPWMMFGNLVPGSAKGMFRLPQGSVRIPLSWSIMGHRL